MNIQRANAISEFVGVISRTERETRCVTPATSRALEGGLIQPRTCHVCLTKPGGGRVLTECVNYPADNLEGEGHVCDATKGGYVCYHVLAALTAACRAVGKQVYFYTRQSEEKANTNAKLYGGMVALVQVAGAADTSGILAVITNIGAKPVKQQPPTVAPRVKPTPVRQWLPDEQTAGAF